MSLEKAGPASSRQRFFCCLIVIGALSVFGPARADDVKNSSPDKLAAFILREGNDPSTSYVRVKACRELRQKLNNDAYKAAALSIKERLQTSLPGYTKRARGFCGHLLIELGVSPEIEAPLLFPILDTLENHVADREVEVEVCSLLKRLGQLGDGQLDPVETIRGLADNMRRLTTWQASLPVLEAAVDAAFALLQKTNGRGMPLILQARKNFADNIVAQQEYLRSNPGAKVGYPYPSDAEVAAFTRKFDALICSVPPPVAASRWRYYVNLGNYSPDKSKSGLDLHVICPPEGPWATK